MELQTMPLRFRVWDDEAEAFCTRSGSIEFSVTDLVVYARDNDFTLQDYYPTEDGELKPKFIISQDSGLKDKNGKSIYTGDIVKVGGRIGEVAYDSGIVIVSYHPDPWDNTNYFVLSSCAPVSKVIGNIWQNPKLLEENNQENKGDKK